MVRPANIGNQQTDRDAGADTRDGETARDTRWSGDENQERIENGDDGRNSNQGNQDDTTSSEARDETAFTFQVSEVAGKQRRKRGPNKPKQGTATKADAEGIAALFMSLANMLAHDLICPEACFTPTETALISAPLIRMLARMPVSVVSKASAWADPVMLLMGLAVWWRRVSTLRRSPPDPGMPLESATSHTETPAANGYDAHQEAEKAAALERARAKMGAV